MLQVDAHQLPAPEVAAQLSSDAVAGLSRREAQRRLAQYGPNELPKANRRSFLRVFLEQFRDFMVLVLLAATAVSIVLGEVGDAVTILLIVVVNAVLGSLQEFRAERSLEALKEMSAPTARVRREGEEQRIPAAEVVPGDVLLLEAGDKPAADARLHHSDLDADMVTRSLARSCPIQQMRRTGAPRRARQPGATPR